ncbi:uncharacterized protein DMAD_04853 [Drosophila madeirensis]|uniref:Uncharacterized protein n=1 Tax=Drosophila madeirensis TaxID=30013 RepID=A0AAU9GEV0_DROMD
MSGKLLSGLLNGVLCGIGAAGCWKLDPLAQPFGYASCILAYTHGTLGLIVSLRHAQNCHNPHLCLTRTLMEVGQLTLINIQFCHSSLGSSSPITLLYGLSMAGLCCLAVKRPKVLVWRTAIGFCNMLCLLCIAKRSDACGIHLKMALLYALGSDGVHHLRAMARGNSAERLYELCNIGITHLAIRAFLAKM